MSNITELISNYSSIDGILYETLIIKNASRSDTGIYTCRYGQILTATAKVIVNHCKLLFCIFYCKAFFLDPGGTKSRRLILQQRGNNSSSKASLRTVVSCFYIVYQIVLVALIALS